jgi:hypothetical protein
VLVTNGPGKVVAVGKVGDGAGINIVGGMGGAIGEMTGWPGWSKRCLAVWLFDESKSMKPHQQLVRQKVDELYQSLGIELADAKKTMRVMSVVASYGKDAHIELKDPTADIEKIREAIDRVPIDDSGTENFLKAINAVLSEFEPYAKKNSRNIVILIVTDEAGDDDDPKKIGADSPLEITLARMKRLNVSVLAFGYEAGALGYEAEQTYDPTVAKDVSPWAWVDRGLDTAFSEMLPHDYYFRAVARIGSGFGPYALSRLCRETGGVYYLLRSASAKPYDYEKLLSGYQPELDPRGLVVLRDNRNAYRRIYMQIIEEWNKLRAEAPINPYYRNDDQAARHYEREMQTIDRLIALLEEGYRKLESLANVSFADTVSAKRWEANRLLMKAQLRKQRFQLLQYKLALIDLGRGHDIPPPGDIGWYIGYWSRGKLRGDDVQKVRDEMKDIQALYQDVIDKHNGTPWSEFAAREMRSMGGYAIAPWSSSKSSSYKVEHR